MRHILAIFVVALLFGQSAAFAETKEIVSEGTYNMGDGETPTVAESRALLQAKRTAVEETGAGPQEYLTVVSSGVSAIATVIIAFFAYTNYKLTQEMKAGAEKHQKEISDLYQAIVIATIVANNPRTMNPSDRIDEFKSLYKGQTKIF